MSKKSNEPRCINVSVVGLSGLDRDQSLYGVGKSCLCNRFVRPLADEYITEHTSVFSASDFTGKVINNDQFLYWGSAAKLMDDGTQVQFQVFEQTEFIDDSNLVRPLSRGGQLVPYPKRCAATKLTSHEKLMYISRDQVALQSDYTQIYMPAGKVTIDGFLVLFDVEASHAKRLEQQEQFLSAVLSYIQKTKKPYVIAASKCDDTQLNLLQEAHRFAQAKKINVPVVETSAHQNVNVELAFIVLAQLVERGKVRSKILPFNEAQKIQKELVERTLSNYQGLISRTVTDFRVIWKNTKKIVEEKQEFKDYRDLCGLDACKKLFSKHIRKLRKEYEDRRFNEYMLKLPNALDELLPSINALELYNWNWQNCQKAILNHKDFDKWMIVPPPKTAWNESDHLLSDDLRIPFDILELADAEKIFKLHVEKLKAAEKKARMKNEFRKLLQLTPQIRPGAQWLEAAVLLQNEECYQYLEDSERCAIFDCYVRELGEQAKVDFQELLFESAGLFTKLGPNVRPSDGDVQSIKETLSTDERYKRLEKLVSVRDILLLNHIALLHSPTRCLCGPEKCRDRLMQEIVATTNNR